MELSTIVTSKNEYKRIAYAPVLVPNEPDSDGETLTAEKIEDVAHTFMEKYRNVDYQHQLNNVGIPIESYILPMEMPVEVGKKSYTLPKGTWILGSKFDEATWNEVMNGDLVGYSVMGVRNTAPTEAMKSAEKSERVLLQDLGEDWIPTHVSVVSDPAVPKAKFFALKSKPVESNKGIIEIVKQVFKSDKEDKDVEFTKEEVEKIVEEAVGKAVEKSVGEAVKSAVEATKSEVEEVEEVEEPEVTDEVESAETTVQELRAEIDELKAKMVEKSRAVKSSDTAVTSDVESDVENDRDVYGRRIK